MVNPEAAAAATALAVAAAAAMRGRSSRGHAAASTSSRREAEDEDPATASDESGDDEVAPSPQAPLSTPASVSRSHGVFHGNPIRFLRRRFPRRRGRSRRATVTPSGSWSARSPTCRSGSCSAPAPTGRSAAAGLVPPPPRRRRLAGRARKGPDDRRGAGFVFRVHDVGTDWFVRCLNRPMEISTKVRPPRFREIIQVPKKVSCYSVELYSVCCREQQPVGFSSIDYYSYLVVENWSNVYVS